MQPRQVLTVEDDPAIRRGIVDVLSFRRISALRGRQW